MSNATKMILIEARRTIEREDKWCHGFFGNNGEICAVHALQKATHALNYPASEELAAYGALGKAMGVHDQESGPEMGLWNDTHTHAEVLAAFDRAISSFPSPERDR